MTRTLIYVARNRVGPAITRALSDFMSGVKKRRDEVKLVLEHAMEACVGVEIYLYSYLASAVSGVE